MASTALSMEPKAVMMSTGMWGQFFLTRSSTSRPEMRGIFMSVMTMSTSDSSRNASAVSGSFSAVTAYPASVSSVSRTSR